MLLQSTVRVLTPLQGVYLCVFCLEYLSLALCPSCLLLVSLLVSAPGQLWDKGFRFVSLPVSVPSFSFDSLHITCFWSFCWQETKCTVSLPHHHHHHHDHHVHHDHNLSIFISIIAHHFDHLHLHLYCDCSACCFKPPWGWIVVSILRVAALLSSMTLRIMLYIFPQLLIR